MGACQPQTQLGFRHFLVQTGLDERIVGGASRVSVASASLPEGYRLLQTAYVASRFVDVLRTHERDFDIRLHDVSRSSNAFVWRFRCRSSFLKMLVCLLGVATTGIWLYRIWWWTNLSLIDRRTALGLAGMFACAWLVTFLVQLKNVFSSR